MRLLLISNSTNPGEPYLDHPEIYVVGLREGTMLLVDNNDINLIGPRKARIFKKGSLPKEPGAGEDFSFLL